MTGRLINSIDRRATRDGKWDGRFMAFPVNVLGVVSHKITIKKGKAMLKIVGIGIAVALTGCASVTGTKLQPVSVQTIEDNREVAGVSCTLTNDAGKWFISTPGSVTIQKSTGDLAVDCAKEGSAGHENVVSKANANVWGNIILGGGIGYIVDRNTDRCRV